MTSLFHLEKEGDIDQLTKLLRKSENEAVRGRAAEILGDVDVREEEEENRVVFSLIGAVEDDDSDVVRAAAIDALDTREAIEELITAIAGEKIATEGAEWVKAEAFVEALTSDQMEMRMAGANVLGRIGNRAATPPLLKQLDDPYPLVRTRVVRALGRIEDPRATSTLVNALDDESTEVRREAADALGRIGGGEALSALLDLMDDDVETIRHIAAVSLGNFGSSKPVDALVGALSDESDVVRRAAVFSLIEVLSNAPPSESHALRETIVEKLSARDGFIVVDSLAEILEEGTQPHQRRNAAWIIGKVTTEQTQSKAIRALVNVLGDDDQMTAQFAATSLATIGGENVEEALLVMLDKPDATNAAMAKAAFTLGKVGGERSRDRLDQLINQTDSEKVRKRAFAALSKLGGRN